MFRGFVEAFLRVLLRSDEAGSSVCLVMQSALESGEATDVVVREFVEPHHARLCRFVGQLRPDATRAERSRAAQSVMALLLHQRLFRPFLDRLDRDVRGWPVCLAGRGGDRWAGGRDRGLCAAWDGM